MGAKAWIVCVLASNFLVSETLDQKSVTPVANPSVRVLVITGGHDFDRASFFAMFNELPDIQWREAVQPAANNLYTKSEARKYDVIVLYDFVQQITEEQKRDFVNLLKEEGKGLVGLHHCIGNYQDWPEFRHILGGRHYLSNQVEEGIKYLQGSFDHDQRFKVEITDSHHPITRGLKDFEIEDETYNGFYVNAGVKSLLRVTHPKSGPVIGWAHQYGKARIVYVQPGHGPGAFDNPSYRLLLLKAIQWANAGAK